MLAGVLVLAVVAAAVTAVVLLGRDTTNARGATGNHPAGTVSAAGEPSHGGVGQPVGPDRAAPGSSAPPTASTTLVDNFTGTGPDTSRWGLYESTGSNGARWLKRNVQVHNGELQIMGAGTDPTGRANTSGGLCWCGSGG